MRNSQSNQRVVLSALIIVVLNSWLALPGCIREKPPGGATNAASAPASLPAKADSTTRAKVTESYGKLPLSFEANEGQFDSRVKFVSRAGPATLFLTPTELALKLIDSDVAAQPQSPVLETIPDYQQTAAVKPTQTSLLMKLVGSNPAAKMTGQNALSGKTNYFIGNDPEKWRVNVSNYAGVMYEQIYLGVDLVFYGNQQQLEYDFIVAPGADPGQIRLAFNGASDMRVDVGGNLVLSTATSEVVQHRPFVYQEVDGARKDITAHYVIDATHQVGFRLGFYDTSKPLVIDPVLAYSTYLGGTSQDGATAISIDSGGNAYVTGFTVSQDFPVTPGAFQSMRRSIFITKLNSTGSALVYSTYLGGSFAQQAGIGIDVDSAGNAYVTGYTTAHDFPVTPGSVQTQNHSRNRSVFVTKLNPEGTGLLYSTYLGGSDVEIGRSIVVDPVGNAYVAGNTFSLFGAVLAAFPVTPGAFQTTYGGGLLDFGGDAFVTKLNPAGSALVYSTYLGGNRDDAASGIAIDTAGNAYAAGGTISANFPITANAYQTISRNNDAFVTKLNPSGTALVYSTFLGGSGGDGPASGIAVDSIGCAYVCGAAGPDFPITPGAFQPVPGGDAELFVTKLNSTGSALAYSTFLGGADSERSTDISVDPVGNAYVTGHTVSTNFPTTANAFHKTHRGGFFDAFLTELSPTGTSLVYSTYLGGVSSDSIAGIVLDSSGSVYLTGDTSSVDFPTSPGAFKTSLGNDSLPSPDAFIVKITGLGQFDLCLQDEGGARVLQINSASGDYQWINCGGAVIGGTAAITTKGCLITLQVNGPDRRLLARIDTCMKSGTASIQVFSQGATFTILDRNSANNSCVCAGT